MRNAGAARIDEGSTTTSRMPLRSAAAAPRRKPANQARMASWPCGVSYPAFQ
jgi:hypothetical protein